MSKRNKQERFEKGSKPANQTHVFRNNCSECLVCRRRRLDCIGTKCLKLKKGNR